MTARGGAERLSVVLITLNEEDNLPRCLASLPDGVEIVILDSGSRDRTPEIARKSGAVFRDRQFTNFADQKNAAMGLATRPWVLMLDADEEMDDALRAAVLAAASQDTEGRPVYRLRRRLVFLGRKMRFGKTIDHPLRLFPRDSGRFESEIHERFVPGSGRDVKDLTGCLFHYSYKNLTDYFERFNRYTTQIAVQHHRRGRVAGLLPTIVRPVFEFCYRYLLRGGFLDGYQGFTYALLSSTYAFVKYAKLRELHAGDNGCQIKSAAHAR